MEILVGKTAGFCGGVANAIGKAKELLKEKKEVYCLGELVHNKQVMEKLNKAGLKVIEAIDRVPEGSTVMIRAHGAPPAIYEEAQKRNITLVDLTCPKVTKIHDLVTKYRKEGKYIFLVGDKEHPEIIATAGFCKGAVSVLETIEEIECAAREYQMSGLEAVVIISQTTYSSQKFDEMVASLKEKYKDLKLEVNKTICNATQIRQNETEELAKQVDCMIIVGGKASSNTKKLYELSKEYCDNIFWVETKENLTQKEIEQIRRSQKVGVMAGASTPEEMIREVVEWI